jgi:hypothetical protein
MPDREKIAWLAFGGGQAAGRCEFGQRSFEYGELSLGAVRREAADCQPVASAQTWRRGLVQAVFMQVEAVSLAMLMDACDRVGSPLACDVLL